MIEPQTQTIDQLAYGIIQSYRRFLSEPNNVWQRDKKWLDQCREYLCRKYLNLRNQQQIENDQYFQQVQACMDSFIKGAIDAITIKPIVALTKSDYIYLYHLTNWMQTFSATPAGAELVPSNPLMQALSTVQNPSEKSMLDALYQDLRRIRDRELLAQRQPEVDWNELQPELNVASLQALTTKLSQMGFSIELKNRVVSKGKTREGPIHLQEFRKFFLGDRNQLHRELSIPLNKMSTINQLIANIESWLILIFTPADTQSATDEQTRLAENILDVLELSLPLDAINLVIHQRIAHLGTAEKDIKTFTGLVPYAGAEHFDRSELIHDIYSLLLQQETRSLGLAARLIACRSELERQSGKEELIALIELIDQLICIMVDLIKKPGDIKSLYPA